MDSFVKLITVFNIKIINRSNKNYQCKTKELLDLSMTRIDRVFVTDYVYVRSRLRRLAKANPGRHVETLKKGTFQFIPDELKT